MVQVRGLCPRVGGHLALFCIHCVKWVYGALVVTSWTCYGTLQIVVSSSSSSSLNTVDWPAAWLEVWYLHSEADAKQSSVSRHCSNRSAMSYCHTTPTTDAPYRSSSYCRHQQYVTQNRTYTILIEAGSQLQWNNASDYRANGLLSDQLFRHTVSVQAYSTTSSWHFLLLTPCTPVVNGWAHCWVPTEVPKYSENGLSD